MNNTLEAPIEAVPFIPTAEELAAAGRTTRKAEEKKPMFTFQPPAFYEQFLIPADAILVGNKHITRGDITLCGGVPGCGKSRLLMALAVAGKMGPGSTWMGHAVHAHFRTAILQSENGEIRLKEDLMALAEQGHDLHGWLHVTPPPPYGLAFHSPEFRAQLKDWLAEVRPGVLAIDPWNKCTPDDSARDFRSVLDAVMEVLPEGPDKPAIVIVHHLRKQSTNDRRKRGRELLNELSGSYIIGSACRVAFILEAATPDAKDERVVLTCAKNNNGEMGSPSAWYRRNITFEPCEEFDFDAWEQDDGTKRRTVELADLDTIFDHGIQRLSRRDAVSALQEHTGLGRTAVYEALKPDGKFSQRLVEMQGMLTFTP